MQCSLRCSPRLLQRRRQQLRGQPEWWHLSLVIILCWPPQQRGAASSTIVLGAQPIESAVLEAPAGVPFGSLKSQRLNPKSQSHWGRGTTQRRRHGGAGGSQARHEGHCTASCRNCGNLRAPSRQSPSPQPCRTKVKAPCHGGSVARHGEGCGRKRGSEKRQRAESSPGCRALALERQCRSRESSSRHGV